MKSLQLLRRGAAAASTAIALLLAAPAAASQAIHIGVLTDYTDPAAGQLSVVAAEIAAEEMGPVLGRPVRIFAYDNGGDAKTAMAQATELVEKHGVHMLTDLVRSSTAIPVQQYAVEKGVIVMPTGAGASELHTKFCSPLAFHWGFDSYALAKANTDAMIRRGGDSWFFVTSDYAFGHSLEVQGKALATEGGARVLGASRYPYRAADISANLLAAGNSGARVIALASGGPETQLAIRQSYELGLLDGSRRLATMLMFITDVRRLGLYVSGGLQIATPFYWDYDERTRALAEKIYGRAGSMPSMVHAGVYSAVRSYLMAVKQAGTLEPQAVADTLRGMRIDDAFARNGFIREDGLMVHDLLFVEVKTASASARAWDYYEVLEIIPGVDAYRPKRPEDCTVR